MEQPREEESVKAQVAGIVRAAVESVARKPQAEDERPTITEKEVSWAEACAAAQARKEYLAREENPHTILDIMALPATPRQKVVGLDFEVYSLAHNTALEQLEHPFVTGGAMSNEDIGVAVLLFASREKVESLIAIYGAAKANKLLRASPDLRALLAYLTSTRMVEINAWFKRQFNLVSEANGEPVNTEATPEK